MLIKKQVYFSRKKLLLINLNTFFPFVTLVIKIYSKMWELWMHQDLWSFVYYINFQIRQILATNHKPQMFLVKKPTLVWVKISEKQSIFPSLRSRYRRQANRKNLILPIKNSSKLWRTWSVALPVYKFLIHLHFFKVGDI